MMDIRPIRTQTDLEWALDQIAPYFEHPPQKGSQDADRFDILADLIEAFENRSFFPDEQEPIAFLQGFMEMTGRTQRDLAELLGSRSRASEILNRKRAMTIDMIHRLKEEWGVPAEALAKPYPLAAA